MNPTTVVVLALISQMGSGDFRTRERAYTSLKKFGNEAALQLLVFEQSSDREIGRRCSLLLEDYYQARVSGMVAYFVNKKAPWIHPVPGLDYDTYMDYLEKGRQIAGIHGPPHFEDFRVATKLWIEDSLRNHRSTDIRPVLDALRVVEKDWIKTYGTQAHKDEDLPCE